MWHGGRSDFARNGALLEVPQADVRPHVSVKVQQDVIVARHCIKQLCYVVVRLNLHSHVSRSDEVKGMSGACIQTQTCIYGTASGVRHLHVWELGHAVNALSKIYTGRRCTTLLSLSPRQNR